MLTTTLFEIEMRGSKREYFNFEWMKNFDNDSPIPISRILDESGLDASLWVIDKLYPYAAMMIAVGFCTPVLRLMKDKRSRAAVKTAHLYAHGEAFSRDVSFMFGESFHVAWDAGRKNADASTVFAARAAYEACSGRDNGLTSLRRVAFCAVKAIDLPGVREDQERLVRYVCDNLEDTESTVSDFISLLCMCIPK